MGKSPVSWEEMGRPNPYHRGMTSLFDPLAIYALIGATVMHQAAGGASVEAPALFNRPGASFGDILMTGYSLRYRTASFPGVKQGDTFTIDGQTFTVREDPTPLHVDGAESIVPLKAS